MTQPRIRVALVDDTEDIRTLMRIVLRSDARFEIVAEGATGLDAVAIAEAHQPDVMVLDLAMPVMDGLQALPEIRRVAPETRVCVLSGFERSRLGSEAMRLGAAAYVEKGGLVATLVDTIASLITNCPAAGPNDTNGRAAGCQGDRASPSAASTSSSPT